MKQYVKLLCLLISIQQALCKNYFDTLKININNYDLKDLIGYHTSHIKAITQSYKKLAVEYHPDKAPGNYLQAYFDKVFKEIGSAKSFLTTLDSKDNRTLVQGYVRYSALLKIFEENQIEIFDTYKGSKSNPIDRTKAISNIQDWISQLAKIITTLNVNDSIPFQNILNSYKALLATIKATPQSGSVDFVQRTDPDIIAAITRIAHLLDQFNSSADSSNLLILDEIRDNYLYFLIVLSENEPLKQRYLEAELLSKRQLENALKSETNSSKKAKLETFIKNRFDTLLSFIDINWNGAFAASLTPSLQQLLAILKGQPQILSAQELLTKINEKIQQGDREQNYEQSQLFYDSALKLIAEYKKAYGPAATWKILAIYVKKLEKLKAWNVDSSRKGYIYDVLIKKANEFINNTPEEIKNGDKFKTELIKYETLQRDMQTILAPVPPQPTKRPLPTKPTQPKIPSLEDRQKATQDIPGLEGVKDNGFVASFLGDGSSIVIPQPISYPGMPQLITILPQLGQYSDQYPTQNILALIQLNPATMAQNLPAEIKNQLPNNVQNFNLNILISGTLDRPISGLTYNFVLHPWIYGIIKTNYFNVNPTAGLYFPQGINVNDLGNNQQRPLNVNAHNGGSVYFSPNNGTFTIQPGQEIATFWSIALYNNNALVTFHIVVNSLRAQNNFIQAGQQAPIIGAYLQNIEHIIIPALTTQQDKTALTNAVATIKGILVPQVNPIVPPIQPPVIPSGRTGPTATVQQQTIKRTLNQFENSLRSLTGAL